MKKITSEEPVDHWGFLNVKDKVVLDLGCSKFHSTIPTYEWFLQEGASKVIGVDLGEEKSDENFTYFQSWIDSDEKIKNFLQGHPIDVIKADIEGAEKYFQNISKENLNNVTEIAIEYHDEELKALVLSKLAEWAFGVVDTYQLFDIDIARMGVIHAKKN